MLPEKWRNPPCYAQACPAKGAQAAFCKGRFCCGVRLPRRRSGAAKIARAQRTLGYFSSKLCAADRCAYPAFCLERAAACPQVFCHSRPVCVAMVAMWVAFSIKGGDCMRFCPLSRFHSGWRSDCCAYPAFCLEWQLPARKVFAMAARVRGQGGLYFL